MDSPKIKTFFQSPCTPWRFPPLISFQQYFMLQQFSKFSCFIGILGSIFVSTRNIKNNHHDVTSTCLFLPIFHAMKNHMRKAMNIAIPTPNTDHITISIRSKTFTRSSLISWTISSLSSRPSSTHRIGKRTGVVKFWLSSEMKFKLWAFKSFQSFYLTLTDLFDLSQEHVELKLWSASQWGSGIGLDLHENVVQLIIWCQTGNKRSISGIRTKEMRHRSNDWGVCKINKSRIHSLKSFDSFSPTHCVKSIAPDSKHWSLPVMLSWTHPLKISLTQKQSGMLLRKSSRAEYRKASMPW